MYEYGESILVYILLNFINYWSLKKSGNGHRIISIIPKFNVNADQRECKGEYASRTKIVSPRTHINTCARRIVNKAPSPSSFPLDFGSHGYLVDPLACVPSKWEKDTGRFRGAAIGGKEGGRGASPVHVALDDFGDPQRDSAFRRFARRPACPHGELPLMGTGARSTGWCIAHGFRPRETLPSATRPCCGRRSCPASRCPVFGYGTDCSHILWENQSEVGPLLSFLYVAFFLHPWLPPPSARFLDRIPEGTLITPRTDAPLVLSEI